MHLQLHVLFNFSILYLFFVNGPQLPYVNPCLPGLPGKVGYPKYISGAKIPASKDLVFILFSLHRFKLSLRLLNYLGWLNEVLFVLLYKKISKINGTFLRGVLIPNLLNSLLGFTLL